MTNRLALGQRSPILKNKCGHLRKRADLSIAVGPMFLLHDRDLLDLDRIKLAFRPQKKRDPLRVRRAVGMIEFHG